MTNNSGIAHEKLAQQVFRALINQDFARNIEVKQNVSLQGISTCHQIDIFWEFQIASIEYRTVVEVKDWSKAVGQGEVMRFKAVLDDLPDQPRGIFVSRSGFQAGARRFASSNGIVLYELRRPTERDLKGRVRSVDITLVTYHSMTSGIRLLHDERWRISEAARLGLDEAPRLALRLNPEEAYLINEIGDHVGTVKEITDTCYFDGFQELPPTIVRHEFSTPTFLKTGCPSFPRLKLTAVEAVITTQAFTQEFGIDVNELVRCILKDSLAGTIREFRHP